MPTQQQIKAIAVFDIDGVIRDVGNSYRRALADTVEQFTDGAYRPTQADIDRLKTEGLWNNDWEASREMVYRHFEAQGKTREQLDLNYEEMVAFFQSKYRGPDPEDPEKWTGYICQEPLLMGADYLQGLSDGSYAWGFFSGATKGSACYVLQKRLGLNAPVLVAMGDAPDKPNPEGLLDTVQQLERQNNLTETVPVIYAGDTVADMQTLLNARDRAPDRLWIGVGILPPHAQQPPEYAAAYAEKLRSSGAAIVLTNVQQLTPEQIHQLVVAAG